MATTLEEDFGGFVAARWPDLEAVALVATLDPERARELTTSALAGLRPRWQQTLEEGAPTAAARRALLARLEPSRGRGEASVASGAPEHGPVVRPPAVDDPDTGVPAALLDALARLRPAVRAQVGAGALWETTDDELRALAGEAAPSRADVDAARRELVAAHRAARAADGVPAADHRLDADLADLAHALARALPEPPDPAGLVVDRARRVRRRALVAGAGGLLLAGGVGWVAVRDGLGADPVRPSPQTPTTAGPDDAAWGTTTRWPARGGLADDLGVQALVARAGAGVRLLWAGEVADLRVVVAATPDHPPTSTAVRAWSGPPGTVAERLVEVPTSFDTILGVEDVVVLGLDRPGGALLLVLTRPTERSAAFSPVVRPTPAGSLEREYTAVALADGVGTMLLPEPWGTAGRVRCAEYDGGPLTPRAWDRTRSGGPGSGPLADLVALVASSTGLSPDDLRGEVLVDSPTDGSVFDPTAVSATGGDGRAVLTVVRTPDGAVVRGLDVRDDGRSGTTTFLAGSPVVVPARLAGEPAVLSLDAPAGGPGRFLVVVPGGGATCRLVAVGRRGAPTSEATAMKRSTAVVSVPDVERTTYGLRLVVQDAAGRTTYDDVPPAGRDLGGYDDGTGWLGLPLPY
ncbi:hypothetical protein [Phycicoccus sonneratiae]|uniref:DNA-directed RNA polymerase specialized sigma24 family protein n=1 Tax=Phycicoccus sonneratiae TaxID=2807628 RepID=A0ABS2CNP8_9MICO|nr:hypothetical protein [Phycicoccus sonneraticus]MBM6401508.1 hypothetical protein [Phycicoccus sonneraticus]